MDGTSPMTLGPMVVVVGGIWPNERAGASLTQPLTSALSSHIEGPSSHATGSISFISSEAKVATRTRLNSWSQATTYQAADRHWPS
jgi:hypothetical protein